MYGGQKENRTALSSSHRTYFTYFKRLLLDYRPSLAKNRSCSIQFSKKAKQNKPKQNDIISLYIKGMYRDSDRLISTITDGEIFMLRYFIPLYFLRFYFLWRLAVYIGITPVKSRSLWKKTSRALCFWNLYVLVCKLEPKILTKNPQTL